MISDKERQILRSLAGKIAEYAALPEMEACRNEWRNFNDLKPSTPKILCSPEGGWEDIYNVDLSLDCQDPLARSAENTMRRALYVYEVIKDDHAFEGEFFIGWDVTHTGYGVELSDRHKTDARGSYQVTACIEDLERDFHLLKHREYTVDKQATYDRQTSLDAIFGDLLPVKIRDKCDCMFGITKDAIDIIGLENLFVYMYDQPDALKALIKFMADDYMNAALWYEKNGLITRCNQNEYVGSGGQAYTNDLPSVEGSTTLKNSWGGVESQETVGISPDMYKEFIHDIIKPCYDLYGLNCYGCCEPVSDKMEYIMSIPNLRRVSVSAWCDKEIAAHHLAGKAVYSAKPNPSLVCSIFDENAIRKDIRETLDIAKNCNVELILKDTHTVQNQPWRFAKWVEIVREEIAK